MTGEISHNHIYDKDKIFELAKNDRIIDPTYDNVEDHLILILSSSVIRQRLILV